MASSISSTTAQFSLNRYSLSCRAQYTTTHSNTRKAVSNFNMAQRVPALNLKAVVSNNVALPAPLLSYRTPRSLWKTPRSKIMPLKLFASSLEFLDDEEDEAENDVDLLDDEDDDENEEESVGSKYEEGVSSSGSSSVSEESNSSEDRTRDMIEVAVTETLPAPGFVLSFLWMDRNIAVAVDNIFSKGQRSPLTEYFIWPRSDAWEELKTSLESKPWIKEKDKVLLLNQTTEVINFWQDEEKKHTKEEARQKFPDCIFM